jgi:hypothetical protein
LKLGRGHGNDQRDLNSAPLLSAPAALQSISSPISVSTWSINGVVFEASLACDLKVELALI